MSVASEINRIKTNIADAYTEAEAKGATMPVTENSANLADTVASIQSTPTLQSKIVTPTTSQQSVTPDSGYDGLSDVTVTATPLEAKTVIPTSQQQVVTPTTPNIGFSSVTVGAAPQPTLITKQITENGTYAAEDDNADGYSEVTVDVPVPTPIEEKAVNFYDYDGTVLYSYTATEALALNSLPALPTHSGLVAQKWNMTLATVKDYAQAGKKINVGCLYDTNDGSTKLYLKVVAGTALPSTELRLRLSPQSSLTVEWGDGTSSVVSNSDSSWLNTTTNHTFTEAETDTEICIRISGDEFELGYDSGTISIFNNATLPLVRLNIGSNCSAINQYALQNCYSLTSITIPDGVTRISENAFGYCYNLTSITIPDSVTSIDQYAFRYCYNLTSITIPDSVTSIGGYAFQQCYSLTSITIPDSVMSIGQYAFQQCYNLTSITIPDSVTSIGGYAFYSCFSLTSVTILDGVTRISENAFGYCYNLTSITIPDSVTSIGQNAFQQCYNLTSITIPDSVTSIGGYAFQSCQNLLSCILSNSITQISEGSFSRCLLYQITIPASVSSIRIMAFTNNKNLQKVNLSEFTDPTAIPTLASKNAFSNVPGKFIVANAEMLAAFQTKTNWSAISSDRWEALS